MRFVRCGRRARFGTAATCPPSDDRAIRRTMPSRSAARWERTPRWCRRCGLRRCVRTFGCFSTAHAAARVVQAPRAPPSRAAVVGGVTRILHLDKKTAADPGLLADVVWRAAILLHSDIVPIYHLGACLLTLVVARRSLADAALGKALVEAAPDFWRVTRQWRRGHDRLRRHPAVYSVASAGARRARFELMRRHAASCGPQPQPILEAERTRLLTCVVALLLWLCEQAATRHSDANDPLTPYVAAARGFGKGFGGSSRRPPRRVQWPSRQAERRQRSYRGDCGARPLQRLWRGRKAWACGR